MPKTFSAPVKKPRKSIWTAAIKTIRLFIKPTCPSSAIHPLSQNKNGEQRLTIFYAAASSIFSIKIPSLPVLDNRRAEHLCVNIGLTHFLQQQLFISPLYAKKPHRLGAVSLCQLSVFQDYKFSLYLQQNIIRQEAYMLLPCLCQGGMSKLLLRQQR